MDWVGNAVTDDGVRLRGAVDKEDLQPGCGEHTNGQRFRQQPSGADFAGYGHRHGGRLEHLGRVCRRKQVVLWDTDGVPHLRLVIRLGGVRRWCPEDNVGMT